MNSFKHIIISILSAISFLFAYIVIFYYQIGAPMTAEYWLRDAKAIKEYVVKNISSPKIIVISGSNALFGINSDLLERESGIATANLALHAGLSVDYYIYLAKKHAKTGDIIIMPLEYEYYSRKNVNTNWFTNQMMTWDSDYFFNLNIYDKLKFIFSVTPGRVLDGTVSQYFRESLKKYDRAFKGAPEVLTAVGKVWAGIDEPPQRDYSFLHIGNKGDTTNNIEARAKGSSDYGLNASFKGSPSFWNSIEDFQEFCTTHEISLFLTWPSIMENEDLKFQSKAVKNSLNLICKRLKTAGIKVLGEPKDFLYPRNYFFNGRYHLNSRGRDIRTKTLMGYLKKALNFK